MRIFLRTLIVVIGILVIVFLAGPRPEVDLQFRPLQIFGDLDHYLAQSEARFEDLKPGTEKVIIWSDSLSKEATPYSIVYLHGFSATRQETRPLCDSLASGLGANLFYTRLAGHGRSNEAMGEASINDWLHDAMEALEIGRRLGEKVVVVGTSTGATLATWLASQPRAEDLHAMVMLSPNFRPKDPLSDLLLWPWGEALSKMVVGEEYSWTPSNELQAQYWTSTYPSIALIEMMSLVDLVEQIDKSTIQVPTLVVYSPLDNVVSVEAIQDEFEKFGALDKQIVSLEETSGSSHHVLAGEIMAPESTGHVTEIIRGFLRSIEK